MPEVIFTMFAPGFDQILALTRFIKILSYGLPMCANRAVESEDATETEALLSAAEQGQAGVGKFFYFSTFVQAALIVHELHLLDLASLRQVCLQIIQ